MEPEVGDGVRGIGGGIPPDDALAAGELLLLGVERDRDVVGDERVGGGGKPRERRCRRRFGGRGGEERRADEERREGDSGRT